MKSICVAIELPPLTTEQAIALWDCLHQVADAIWDVHGEAMVDVFAQLHLQEVPPDDVPYSEDPQDDVPF